MHLLTKANAMTTTDTTSPTVEPVLSDDARYLAETFRSGLAEVADLLRRSGVRTGVASVREDALVPPTVADKVAEIVYERWLNRAEFGGARRTDDGSPNVFARIVAAALDEAGLIVTELPAETTVEED